MKLVVLQPLHVDPGHVGGVVLEGPGAAVVVHPGHLVLAAVHGGRVAQGRQAVGALALGSLEKNVIKVFLC